MKLSRAIQRITVKIGLALLKTSGAYAGYWNTWRGRLFDDAERMGLHVLPVHYYTPIPDTRAIPETVWRPRGGGTGLDLRIDDAFELTAEFAAKYSVEYNAFDNQPASNPRDFTLANKGYGAGDAELYYSMLRHFKPRRVIEIGCGHSTLVAAMALRKNREEGAAPLRYTCIEPYLPLYLRPLPDPVMDVVESGVQSVPIEFFGTLGSGDFLFIDSTHVAAIGSDVTYEFLEILPRLNPGVIVHVHDIFIPDEYPRDWIMDKRFFWNEQYLLQAFLLHNDDYEIMAPIHALCAARPDEMLRCIPSLKDADGRPASFWMRKKIETARSFTH